MMNGWKAVIRLRGGGKMFGKKDSMKEAKEKLRLDAFKNKLSQMTDTQLIMALILAHDSAGDQAFYSDDLLGKEAMKRCNYNPYGVK